MSTVNHEGAELQQGAQMQAFTQNAGALPQVYAQG